VAQGGTKWHKVAHFFAVKCACTEKHGQGPGEVMFHCMNEMRPADEATWEDADALMEQLDAYLAFCRQAKDGTEERSRGKGGKESLFPNLAGFCRWMGGGLSDAEALRTVNARLYGRIGAVLEDEALNADLSPTVLSAYLKRRLGYGDTEGSAKSTAVPGDGEQLRLVFDHDILEDGK